MIIMIIYSSRDHTALPPLIPMDATSLHLDGNNLGNVLLRQVLKHNKFLSYESSLGSAWDRSGNHFQIYDRVVFVDVFQPPFFKSRSKIDFRGNFFTH